MALPAGLGAALAWWAATVALLLAAVPLATGLVPRRGRGAGLALPIALTVLTVAGLWAGHVSTALALPASLAVLLGLSAIVLWHRRQRSVSGAVPATGTGGAPEPLVRQTAVAVGVYSVAFAGYTALRTAAPGVNHGGEQFLDYGLLTAILRAPALPPEDFWFAGEPVQYYYGGHLAVAQLVELTGVAPRYAFHLGIASALAAAVAGVWTVAGVAAETAGGDRRGGAAAAAGLVGLGGHPAALGWLLEGGPVEETATAFSLPGGVAVVPLLEALEGTLHAHVLAAPILVLAVGLAQAAFHDERAGDDGGAAAGGDAGRNRDRRRLAVVCGVAMPVVVAGLVVTSTWALPTALGVLALALAVRNPPPTAARVATGERGAPARRGGEADAAPDAGRGPRGAPPRAVGSAPHRTVASLRSAVVAVRPAAGWVAGRLARALAWTVVAAIGGAVLAAPFLALSARSYGVAAVNPEMRSGLGSLVAVHGGLALLLAAGLLAALDRRRAWALAAAGLGVGALVVAAPLRLAALGLCVPLAALGLARLAGAGHREAGMASVLTVAGAGIVLVPEIAYVLTDGPGNRFNTVFKLSMHAWLVWGIAAGALVGVLVDRVAERLAPAARPLSPAVPPGTDRSLPAGGGAARLLARLAALAVVAVLLLPSAAYPALTIPDHAATAPGEPTLDGLRWIEAEHAAELAAIRWLDRDAVGQPTMVSAPGTEMYRWSAAPAASLTGVPTLAGWAHERQYRSPAAYRVRVRATDRLYVTTWPRRLAVLDRYDVRYVWAGPAERERYGDVPEFARLAGVEVGFANDVVTVYVVDQGALGPGETAGATDAADGE